MSEASVARALRSSAFGRIRPNFCRAALVALYGNATVERRHVRRADVGASAVGHFGFFRDRFRSNLWDDAARFLQR